MLHACLTSDGRYDEPLVVTPADMIKWSPDDRIQPFRLRPLKAQGFRGYFACRVGAARTQPLRLVHGQVRNLFAKLWGAHVLMLDQRGEGPAIPMFRSHMFCKGPAHEAGMASDQQLGHGVGRGRLRSIEKQDMAAPFMLPGS